MSGGKRILIVEDQRLIAADLEGTLKKLGYQVVANAAEGQQAVDKALALAPDLILMDIRLRGPMDGIEAATKIRESSDVPIVYLTAYADEETITRATRTSAFGYVVKPFNERELRAAIEIALYRHETERLLGEERARRLAAEEFKLLVEGVKDYGIFRLDGAGRVASWNEGARRLSGYEAEDVVGKHFSVFRLQGESEADRPEQLLELAVQHGRAEFEGWWLRSDRTRFWANVVVTPIRDETGELRGFGQVVRDLTERKRAEQERDKLIAELQDAVHSRDEFLQIASHELRTPLTPLQLQLDTLYRAIEKAGIRSEHLSAKLDTATRQTTRLSRLVESLLDVSRITAGRVVLDPEPLDVAEVARDVAERFRPEARRVGSEIVVSADTGINGRWDRLHLEQILSNLISNAIKYGGGSTIEIDAAASEDTVRVSVTDHGIGIEKQAMERIFDRFERAVSTRHFGGLGLGLFIARQFAEAHGGSIVAQSQPGAGSTFTMVLPREAPAHVVSPAGGLST